MLELTCNLSAKVPSCHLQNHWSWADFSRGWLLRGVLEGVTGIEWEVAVADLWGGIQLEERIPSLSEAFG